MTVFSPKENHEQREVGKREKIRKKFNLVISCIVGYTSTVTQVQLLEYGWVCLFFSFLGRRMDGFQYIGGRTPWMHRCMDGRREGDDHDDDHGDQWKN